MPKRKIVVLQDNEAWNQYLIEAFEDTPSTPEIVRTAHEALPLVRQGNPDVIFANPDLLTKLLVAALSAHRTSNSNFRAYSIGPASEPVVPFPFDERFPEIPQSLYEFHKKLVERLPVPDPIRLLVVDDEPGVGEMFRDYFDHRTSPAFVVETAPNGLEGEKRIHQSPPDVLVLDIKMPERDGRELYQELKRTGKLPPAIVFFDIVSADEVLEIRKWGHPAFVEKGSRSSGMPEMSALIKKLAYFG